MDPPLPDDFDPYRLGHKPMQSKRQRDDERNEGDGAPQDQTDNGEASLPMFHVLPPALRKLLFTGSCCVGVAVLYMLSAWDHGWVPGFSSSFAAASEVQNLKSDVEEMYLMSLSSAIRDLSTDNCTAQSRALDDQINVLRLKYRARTGGEYPHSDCKKI